MNDFNLKGIMQARSFDLLGEIVSLKSLIPEDFEMDDAPVETDSTIQYQKSFARLRSKDFYKLEKGKGMQTYSDDIAVVCKQDERHGPNFWQLQFCKLTPETGEEGSKSNTDWSGSSFLHGFNMSKGYIDFDGDMIVVSGPAHGHFRTIVLFLSKTRMHHYSLDSEDDSEGRWMYQQCENTHRYMSFERIRAQHYQIADKYRKGFHASILHAIADPDRTVTVPHGQ